MGERLTFAQALEFVWSVTEYRLRLTPAQLADAGRLTLRAGRRVLDFSKADVLFLFMIAARLPVQVDLLPLLVPRSRVISSPI